MVDFGNVYFVQSTEHEGSGSNPSPFFVEIKFLVLLIFGHAILKKKHSKTTPTPI
jgi:hypothetical protein